MTRASTCITTRASRVLHGTSTCSSTCASTCVTTHASTCITTRASTCHYTRARLLFKNMHPGYVFLYQNLKLFEENQKKTVFCIFLCHSQNNFQVAANRTLSKIDALHIAHFEDYVPLFSKHMRKLAIPSKIWV